MIGQPSLCSIMAASAANAARWTTKVLQKANARFLNSLWLRKKLRRFGIELVHSTPDYPQGYLYVKNASTLKYELLYSSITFFGHTHKPAAYLYTKEKETFLLLSLFQQTNSITGLCWLKENQWRGWKHSMFH